MSNEAGLPEWRKAPRTLTLGGAWVVLPMALGFLLLARLDLAAQWLQSLGGWSLVVYILVFACTSGLGLLPTYAQALAGGWIFGTLAGALGALGGFVGGACIGRLVAGRLTGNELQRVLDGSPKAATVRDALLRRGPWGTTGIITLLRLPPNSPFALSNLALTACGARWMPYLAGTALGMLPRTTIIVALGAAGSATGAQSLLGLMETSERRWMMFAGIAVAVIVLVVLAAIARRALDRATATHSKTNHH
ncbi:MAG: VTT domain-containing protein [Phycisphaerales bacterium]|nr:VTT domain-containing protein [Phycisphaerales bacterium]